MNSVQVDRLTEIASPGKEAAEKWLVIGRALAQGNHHIRGATLARMAGLKGRRYIHFSD
jgi:hypothetical protein